MRSENRLLDIAEELQSRASEWNLPNAKDVYDMELPYPPAGAFRSSL